MRHRPAIRGQMGSAAADRAGDMNPSSELIVEQIQIGPMANFTSLLSH